LCRPKGQKAARTSQRLGGRQACTGDLKLGYRLPRLMAWPGFRIKKKGRKRGFLPNELTSRLVTERCKFTASLGQAGISGTGRVKLEHARLVCAEGTDAGRLNLDGDSIHFKSVEHVDAAYSD